MSIIADDFNFKEYMAKATQNSDVLRPRQLKLAQEYYAATARGDLLPWPKTHEDLQFRPCEVTLWNGINGQGKSLLTGQVAFSLMAAGIKVAIASFEMRPVKTLGRIARQVSGCKDPTPEWLDGFEQWCEDKLWMMGTQGRVDPQRAKDFCEFVALKHGVKHVFVDNLMKVCPSEEDKDAMSSFVDALCTIARDRRIHIHLVVHPRKTENEYTIPDKFDVRGPSAIVDQVDNLITVFRNKRKEEQMEKLLAEAVRNDEAIEKLRGVPDTLLICCKQRHGDWEGRIGLYVHKESMFFLEGPRHRHPLPQLFDVASNDSVIEGVPF